LTVTSSSVLMLSPLFRKAEPIAYEHVSLNIVKVPPHPPDIFSPPSYLPNVILIGFLYSKLKKWGKEGATGGVC
jgi:hypothetical protein